MSSAFLIGICLFLLALLTIAISNRAVVRKLEEYSAPQEFLKVSVLVPARNEEANIEACIQSLLGQRYPDFELLVLNDESEDLTSEIVAKLAKTSPRLQVYQGNPLPLGWLGKSWACAQLAGFAEGELLLFTDADTRHEPDAIAAAVAAMQDEQADLLAVWPRLLAESWGEKLLVPLIPWSVFSILSVPLAYRLRFPALSAAIGQFLLFRRSAYFSIGGHEGVRQHVAEDLALARRVKRNGLRWRIVDGQRHVRTRMYSDFRTAWRGMGKNLYAAFDYRSILLVLAWLWLVMVAWVPILIIAAAIASGSIPEAYIQLAGIAIGLMLAVWLIGLQNMGQPLSLALLYPLLMAMGFLVSLQSLLLTRSGLATWKGRRLVGSGKSAESVQ